MCANLVKSISIKKFYLITYLRLASSAIKVKTFCFKSIKISPIEIDLYLYSYYLNILCI